MPQALLNAVGELALELDGDALPPGGAQACGVALEIGLNEDPDEAVVTGTRGR